MISYYEVRGNIYHPSCFSILCNMSIFREHTNHMRDRCNGITQSNPLTSHNQTSSNSETTLWLNQIHRPRAPLTHQDEQFFWLWQPNEEALHWIQRQHPPAACRYGASVGGSLCDTSKTYVRQVRLTSHESKPHKKHNSPNKHHHHGGGAANPCSGVDLMNPRRPRASTRSDRINRTLLRERSSSTGGGTVLHVEAAQGTLGASGQRWRVRTWLYGLPWRKSVISGQSEFGQSGQSRHVHPTWG